MKKTIILLVIMILLPHFVYGAQSNTSTWFGSKLYGHDNSVARLSPIKLTKDHDRAFVYIQSQFGFKCELVFDGNGNPSKLLNCRSDDSPDWSVREKKINLRCGRYGKEQICEGKYTLVSGSYSSADTFKIARRMSLKKYPLYVGTAPENSRIRILNIAPRFTQGIKLPPGRYHVEVSNQDFVTKKQWVEITNKAKSLNIALTRSKSAGHGKDYLSNSPGYGNTQTPQAMVSGPGIHTDTMKRRLALIIGNADYSHGGRLLNPVNDAVSMKKVLRKLNFEVIKYENCDQRTMKRAMDKFGRKLDHFDVGLFFYAGHGVQVGGHNYLIPVDARLENENEVEYDCVRADRILAKMESAGNKANIVILDACRDNPFERSWRRGVRGQGLAFMNAPSGSFIAYATSPGSTASDGSGGNGLYTAALMEHIGTPNISIEDVFKRVRATVLKRSGNKQTPWESTSLIGYFYFKSQ